MTLAHQATAAAATAPVTARSHYARVECGLVVPVAGIVFAAPFAAYTGLVLYHFYVRGSFLLDPGLEAFLVSAGDLRLSYPAALGGGSYFHSHAAPILIALSLVKRALPMADVQFFAGFIGLAHALPGLGVFWALRAGSMAGRGTAAGGIVLPALLAIGFSFNGLALAIVRYPHFEMLIVAAAILFAVALVQRRLVLASICLAVALATREDAGFHLFALLAVLIALNRRYRIPWREQRAEIVFAAVALGYGAAVLGLQLALSSGPSAFAMVYLGQPPFAKLTAGMVAQRLLGWAAYRPYVVLPAIVALVWAARTRNPYLLVGYAAFLPWGLLQLLAASDNPGTLSAYYAYPFMIASFWPLVGVMLDRRRRTGVGSGPAMMPSLAFAAMIAASLVGIGRQANPGRLDLATAFLSPPALSVQAATERAMAEFVRSKPALGPVIADTSVVALAPNDFLPSETVVGHGSVRPDTVIYFEHGYEADRVRRIAAAAGLDRHYRVPGTALRIASDRTLAAAASAAPAPPSPIAALLVAAPPGD